jgi:hypothetical protein
MDALDGVEVRGIPVSMACRYENSYRGLERTQLLPSEGTKLSSGAIAERLLPDEHFDAACVAPAFQEVSSMPSVPAAVQAVSLQGVLRAQTCGRVHPVGDPITSALPFAGPDRLLFCSVEDIAGFAETAFASVLVARGAVVVITKGDGGATLYRPDTKAVHFAATTSETVVDPTGAGDAFETAFVIRLAETNDYQAAMVFALAAGSLAVERTGVFGMPSRVDVESRAKVAGIT